MTTTPSNRAPQLRWIWPFELLDQIGEGGMGVVYRARYVVNGRHVALKMLPADVTDQTVLARFEREVEVLKNLKHPNIVRCFGGSCENQRRFYAMELVEGGTLEERLKQKGKLPWEQVVFYALQMCAALECSHGQGVVHRDIKPSNFLITSSGQIKLSDFGLASVEASRKITAAGKTAGTFLYMAPEQIRGQEVTPQTDLYALGCVLYELLTGHPPFIADTPAATLHLHCHVPPPRVREQVPSCPEQLDELIVRLMAKSAVDRPASAAEVAQVLKQLTQPAAVVPVANLANVPQEQRPKAVKPTPPASRTAQPQPHQSQLLMGLLVISLLISLFWNLVGQGLNDNSYLWQQRWIEAADHENIFVRAAAVDALTEMAPHSLAGREALAKRLLDQDPMIRRRAAEGLGATGRLGSPYMPQMLKLQQFDVDGDVRNAATMAVASIREDVASRGTGSSIWLLGAAVLIGLSLGGYYWHRVWKAIEQEARAPVGKPVSI